jgi:GTP-binding protein
VNAYETVCGELDAYGAGLSEKPQVLALNKIDAVDAKECGKIRKRLEKASGQDVLLMSGAAGEGIDDVLDRLFELAGAGSDDNDQSHMPVETSWSPI